MNLVRRIIQMMLLRILKRIEIQIWHRIVAGVVAHYLNLKCWNSVLDSMLVMFHVELAQSHRHVS